MEGKLHIPSGKDFESVPDIRPHKTIGFIEIIKDNGQRLLLNTNNIISIYDMATKESHKVMINTINEKGDLVQFVTAANYDDIKSQLK